MTWYVEGLSEEQQRMHAKTFDDTLALLTKMKREGSLTAVAIIHASIFYLVRHNSRPEIYDWLQKICDDLVI